MMLLLFVLVWAVVKTETDYCLVTGEKIVASDRATDDEFGRSVSISGNYAIVGAYEDEAHVGSAYIYVKDGLGWIQEKKLIASDAGIDWDQFGYSVSISGDYAIVGAYGDESKTGAAYIFVRNETGWFEQVKLTASDGMLNDYFGYSVSISGDYAIIGAYGDGSFTGAAYVFERNGMEWIEQIKLLASDGASNDYFGIVVSISGDDAIIGASGDESKTGAAYIFVRNETGWFEQVKLTASDGMLNDYFGSSVSISGDYAIVGAYRDESKIGAAYIFVRNETGWFEQVKLLASDGETDDQFGYSVSISGNYAIVGANGDELEIGSAYVFVRSGVTWTEQVKLTATDGETGDEFGIGVSTDGVSVIVGANGDDSDTGSAYVYSLCEGCSGGGVILPPCTLPCDGHGSCVYSETEPYDPECNCDDGYSEDDCSVYQAPLPPCTLPCDGHGDCVYGEASPYDPECSCEDGYDGVDCSTVTCDAECTKDCGDYGVCVKGDDCLEVCDCDDGIGEELCTLNLTEAETIYCLMRENKIAVSGVEADEYFGWSVSVDGDYAIVGAPYDISSVGSAYIFVRSGTEWIEQDKLVALDGASNDLFGYSVSISGDYAIVGAYGDDDSGSSSGSAYIFVRNETGWFEQVKLTASDGATSDLFGWSVSISGDYAIVGANGDESAYIFIRSGVTWTEQEILTASDGTPNDFFGYSVSISGDYAIVGAYADDTETGSSYIFVRNGSSWTQQAKLLASDGATYNRFGYSVAISGDYAIVGAGDDEFGAGSSYVFVRSGSSWTQQAKLLASDGALDDHFGYSVSISGDYAIVGAYGTEPISGSVYIYVRSGTSWSEQIKLTTERDDGVVDDDGFGYFVSTDGVNVIVGVNGGEYAGIGYAYIYSLCEGCSGGGALLPRCSPSCINGTCAGPGVCSCFTGYEGSTCEEPICTIPCVYGDCVAPDVCGCWDHKYSGALCDKPNCVSGCVHGNCRAYKTCKCLDGWWGPTCELTAPLPDTCFNISSLEYDDVCSGHGICYGTDLCSCDEHYDQYADCSVKDSCYGIDYDDQNVCSDHGDCMFSLGAWLCDCDEHFYGIHCNETSIPECDGYSALDEDVCNGHGDCISDDDCLCDQYYEGDECLDSTMPDCFGYPAIDQDTCGGHGDCIGDDSCSCDMGYEWIAASESCQAKECNALPWNDDDVCSRNGKCSVTTKLCVCAEGWTGMDCEKPECGGKTNDDADVCNAKGVCVSPNLCNCTDGSGYSGSLCATPSTYPDFFCKGWDDEPCFWKDCDWFPENDDRACGPHGTCIRFNKCECDWRWKGKVCHKKTPMKRIYWCLWHHFKRGGF